jgi:hypothetical protein
MSSRPRSPWLSAASFQVQDHVVANILNDECVARSVCADEPPKLISVCSIAARPAADVRAVGGSVQVDTCPKLHIANHKNRPQTAVHDSLQSPLLVLVAMKWITKDYVAFFRATGLFKVDGHAVSVVEKAYYGSVERVGGIHCGYQGWRCPRMTCWLSRCSLR